MLLVFFLLVSVSFACVPCTWNETKYISGQTFGYFMCCNGDWLQCPFDPNSGYHCERVNCECIGP